MYSDADTAEAVGCPIQISTDQRMLAPPRGFSQRATSFIASQCQGIHQMPLRRLIAQHLRQHATHGSKAPSCATAFPQRFFLPLHCIQKPTSTSQPQWSQPDRHQQPVPAHHTRTPQSRTGGGERTRTDDPLLAKQVLSQLSYTPALHSRPKPPSEPSVSYKTNRPFRRHPVRRFPTSRIEQHFIKAPSNRLWWAREDLNFRPHAYQACALTN